MWSRIVDFPYKNVTSQQHKYTKTYKYFLFVCVYEKYFVFLIFHMCKQSMNDLYSKMGKLMQYRMSELSTLHFLGKNVQFAKKGGKFRKHGLI